MASGWQRVTTHTKHLIKTRAWELTITAHFYALLAGLNCNPRVGMGLPSGPAVQDIPHRSANGLHCLLTQGDAAAAAAASDSASRQSSGSICLGPVGDDRDWLRPPWVGGRADAVILLPLQPSSPAPPPSRPL